MFVKVNYEIMNFLNYRIQSRTVNLIVTNLVIVFKYRRVFDKVADNP